jgi:Beta-lactamase/Domain of unknown function (DUF3471)
MTPYLVVGRRSRALAFASILLSAGVGEARTAAPKPATKAALPADLDAFVARTLREFEVPGLALAIVKDGQPLLLKGYGVRRLGAPAPVTANTLFGIASNTKAFTAAALAMLVDEGKLSWDDPVTKHLPEKQAARRVLDSKPALPLASYCRRYRDAWYGEVAIAMEDGGPVIRFSRSPSLVGDLEHWQHETFVARWRDRSLNADAFVTFALGPDGGIEHMKMAPVSPATDFSFDFQDLLFTPVAEARDGSAK